MSWERRLPPFAEDALTILRETPAAQESDLSKADAARLLAEDDRFTHADAEHALEVLQNRGHIYYVDDCVRITPVDD